MRSRALLLSITCAAATISMSSIALAADPIGGAIYAGSPNAKFSNPKNDFENLTVTPAGNRVDTWHLNVPSICSDGSAQDWFYTGNGGSAFPVRSDGSFANSATFLTSGAGGRSHLKFTLSGQFTEATSATLTLSVRDTPTSSSAPSCQGSLKFDVRTDRALTRKALLAPPPDPQSSALAPSADGTVVATGDPDRNAAYVFARRGRAWSSSVPPVKLSAPRGAGSGFGQIVAISGDGRTIVAGSIGKPLFVFTVGVSGRWAVLGHLPSIPGQNEFTDIAISYHGLRIFGLEGNRVDVFFRRRLGTGRVGYVRTARVSSGGTEMAVSSDGSTIVLLRGDGGNAYVYSIGERGSWTGAGKPSVLLAVADGSQFDTHLAVNADGSTIAAGDNEHGLDYAGSVYVYVRRGTRWSGTATFTARLNAAQPLCIGACDQIGSSLAISPDGAEILGGAGISSRILAFMRPRDGWRSEHESFQAETPSRPLKLAVANNGTAFAQDISSNLIYVFHR